MMADLTICYCKVQDSGLKATTPQSVSRPLGQMAGGPACVIMVRSCPTVAGRGLGQGEWEDLGGSSTHQNPFLQHWRCITVRTL